MEPSNAHHKDHHQQHHHSNEHDSAASFTERNRVHWNQFAASYTAEQWQKDMISKITEFIISSISWIGVDFVLPSSKFEQPSSPRHAIRVLDYACGPGTMTAALISHATKFIGIDLSENMVNAYNARFITAEDGAEPVNAQAVVGNLIDLKDASPSSLSDPRFFNFDLVVIGLGFHHFENLDEATKRLASRLKSGGILLILDFLPHDAEGERHPAAHTVAHLGFGEERVRELFEGAGLVDIGIRKMDGEVLMRGLSTRNVFMGKGKKA